MPALVRRAGEQRLSVLVVVPCLNEAPTVERVVRGVPEDIPGVSDIRVLVLDDGSTDGTAERARAAGAEVIQHEATLGQGATFREGVGLALDRGVDLLVHIDGDGQFNPADIPTLVEPVVAKRAHMVTASRFLEAALIPRMPLVKRWGNYAVARLVHVLTGKRFLDVSCGFRVFSREALLQMNLFGSLTYTQECFLDLIFKNLTILEIPLGVRGTREHGSSRVASSLPRYALRSLQVMLRVFIAYRPFWLFLAVSGVFLTTGAGFLLFLVMHYVSVGAFAPHIWAGFVGGAFTFLGVSTLLTGLIGDMLVGIRLNQEHILYRLKRSQRND